VRTFIRFRWLLLAVGLPLCVLAVGLAMQVAAFSRPSRDSLVAANALSKLMRYHVMRGTERVDGRSISSVCIQGWFRRVGRKNYTEAALAVLGNGERLYDTGNGVHIVGPGRPPRRVDRGRFLLAGCPRLLGARIAAGLTGAKWFDADPSHSRGGRALVIEFGSRSGPIELYVNRRTLRPIELVLSGDPIRGWNKLDPGGGRPAIVRVRRAFRDIFRWNGDRA
jgi:hypothetical protein